MIALIVIGAILILLLVVLLLPINVFLSFENDFFVKLSFAKIKIFESEKEEKTTKKSEAVAETQAKKSDENTLLKNSKQLFLFLKEKYGFSGAVKSILGFLKDELAHIKKLLRHIKINRLTLDITVASANAAETAIEYGKICGVAYPVLAFLNSYAKIGLKSVNINTDFDGNTPQFKFSVNLKLQLIRLLVVAYKVYSEYKKFVLKENFNG